ncbi:N(4)-(beta-N-acetylglucosaminyl)-L-asparaginase [candidate division KSB1 bacterium]|nr:N(4)-(beta-N-acetylglucosaminyl)-L-asparaginase [candidate division KSB1 bacterium]
MVKKIWTRRDFLQKAGLVGLGLSQLKYVNLWAKGRPSRRGEFPVVISTWKHGLAANTKAGEILMAGGKALDAVEKGVNVSEADPELMSVGYGGLPDEDGVVTLDACIMGPDGNCGAVAFLQDIVHPISVARRVMERSDHVMLVGEGALRFALAHGFKRQNLLTDKARERWLEWKEKLSDQDDWFPPPQGHDTISMIALDKNGDLAGACTTSGLAFKIHGRVGDSPIIGAGLYVDNGVGGAGATGRGEAAIKTCGSFLVVEEMRRGASPQEACEAALQRLIKQRKGKIDFQLAFIALNKDGEIGAASLKDGLQYAHFTPKENKLKDGKYLIKD